MKIAIAGKFRSGKDQFAKYFLSKGFMRAAFGDELTELIMEYFPEAIIQHGKPREHYTLLGQTFRKLNPMIWIERLEPLLEVYEAMGHDIVITDLRQQNEYEFLKENGYTIIKIEADEEVRKQRIIDAGETFDPKRFYHETELSVDSLPYDYLVTNNTTLDDLFQQAEFIYNELKGEGTT
ncbi:AAA family ATPase [Priestia megaterium]